jgi:membrane-associated protease RseP (regulator of RpoE activity)
VLDTADGKSVSRIGIQLDTKIGSVETVRVPIATGARKAGAQIVELAPLTFKALGKFFAPDQLTKYSKAVANAGTPGATKEIDDTRFMSPVGTVNMLAAASNNSFTDGIMLFGAINVFVGMFNMVPMLPLDGGHVLVATYERIRSTRKRRYIADVRKLMPAAYAVMFLMLMLGISSLYLDLRAPISLP